jgi:hypothetical protein
MGPWFQRFLDSISGMGIFPEAATAKSVSAI